jgi:putative colanic acid biosynthesis glycosyltransferase WcaI
MRVLFLTHYFHPEVGASQTRILESARVLHARGHQVTVLTGFPNYPDGVIPEPYRGRWRQTEWLDGIKVIRRAVYPAPNRGFWRRLINHGSFALSSMVGSREVGEVDVVVAETPPLPAAVAAVVVARRRRARLLLNVADLWPESAIQLGALKNPVAIRAAEAMEHFAYRHADTITVPTPGMHADLLARGNLGEKVRLLPNGVNLESFDPDAWPTGPPKRVVYCGTVGMAHGVRTLLEAARELVLTDPDVEVLIVGDGAERAELEALASAWDLHNVTFAGRVLHEQVPQCLRSADIAVMTLRGLPLFEHALPMKLLEYMAAGRPVAAAAAGQVATLLTSTKAGIASRPEDPHGIADSIRRLAADPEAARAMGARGRRFVEQNLSRPAIVDRLELELESLNGAPTPSARQQATSRDPERVSLVMPVRNEGSIIEEAVSSVLAQRADGIELELLVVDGRSTDGSTAILREMEAREPRLRVLDNPQIRTPHALNIGLREARGEYVWIAGAHSVYDPDYLAVCLQELRRHSVVGCSGRVIVEPANESVSARLVAWVMSSTFASSAKSFRTMADGYADTIPFPVFEKRALIELGGYNERLFRNQDNDMNSRLRAAGHRLYYTWKTESHYRSQANLRALMKYGFRTGKWNVLTLRENERAMSPRHFAPLAFVALLSAMLILAAIGLTTNPGTHPLLWWLPAAVVAVHLAVGAIVALPVAIRNRRPAAMLMPIFILCFHVSYGAGMLLALLAGARVRRG